MTKKPTKRPKVNQRAVIITRFLERLFLLLMGANIVIAVFDAWHLL